MRFPSRKALLVGFGFATAVGLILFGYRYLDLAARARTEPFGVKLIEELSAAWGVALLAPLVAWWTRLVRRRSRSWPTAVLAHAPTLVLFSFLHTSWNALARPLLFRLAGLGAYDYGIMPVRYAMEFWIHIVIYVVIVGAVGLLDQRTRLREHETRLARAEAELGAARLRELEARLHPHFLFNALNTVSSVMYEDVRAADRMITGLSDLLRRALRDDAHEVPLRDELETVDLWVEIMRARFGERLEVTVVAEEAAGDARVPPLLLQPLLENAIKHADPAPEEVLRVGVRARRAADFLILEVEDNGDGLRTSEEKALRAGVGLSTTRRRLEVLYDGAQRMTLGNGREGGLLVSVSIPWREAASGGGARLARSDR